MTFRLSKRLPIAAATTLALSASALAVPQATAATALTVTCEASTDILWINKTAETQLNLDLAIPADAKVDEEFTVTLNSADVKILTGSQDFKTVTGDNTLVLEVSGDVELVNGPEGATFENGKLTIPNALEFTPNTEDNYVEAKLTAPLNFTFISAKEQTVFFTAGTEDVTSGNLKYTRGLEWIDYRFDYNCDNSNADSNLGSVKVTKSGTGGDTGGGILPGDGEGSSGSDGSSLGGDSEGSSGEGSSLGGGNADGSSFGDLFGGNTGDNADGSSPLTIFGIIAGVLAVLGLGTWAWQEHEKNQRR